MTATIEAVVAPGKDLGPWSGVWPKPADIPLGPAPLDSQPSAYIQAAWKDRPYGTTATVSASAAVAEGSLLVRLEWQADAPRFAITDNNVFADACAVMLPANGKNAALQTMGSPDEPVVTWYWRAGADAPFLSDATGLGTVARRAAHELSSNAEWNSGRWAVVFRVPLGQDGLPGGGGPVLAAFAVWSGASEERAGLAAYSLEWSQLVIPASSGRGRR